MSIFAFKCDNGKKIGACPQLVRAGMANIKPMEATPKEINTQIRVLHVDDMDLVRKMVVRIFRGTNVSVTSADGHASALEILGKDRNFDAIVLDFDMGNENGAQLFWKLPGDLRSKAVFFSGENDQKNLEKIQETGRPLINKVGGQRELVEKIKEIASQNP